MAPLGPQTNKHREHRRLQDREALAKLKPICHSRLLFLSALSALLRTPQPSGNRARLSGSPRLIHLPVPPDPGVRRSLAQAEPVQFLVLGPFVMGPCRDASAIVEKEGHPRRGVVERSAHTFGDESESRDGPPRVHPQHPSSQQALPITPRGPPQIFGEKNTGRSNDTGQTPSRSGGIIIRHAQPQDFRLFLMARSRGIMASLSSRISRGILINQLSIARQCHALTAAAIPGPSCRGTSSSRFHLKTDGGLASQELLTRRSEALTLHDHDEGPQQNRYRY